MNTGKIVGTEYIKYVNFNKAVLWKNRELSIPPVILQMCKMEHVNTLRFIDINKKQEWRFALDGVEKASVLRRVGQEEQYYFPIDSAVKKDL